MHSGFLYRRGNTASWGKGDNRGLDGSRSVSEAQSSEWVNPENHTGGVSSLRRNEPLRGSNGDATGEKGNTDGADKSPGATLANANYCSSVTRGNLRFGRKEGASNNEESKGVTEEHAPINEPHSFPFSVGVMADGEVNQGVNGQHNKRDLASGLEKNVEGVNAVRN